uniref:Uncharacterized protein n=1 Tax=Panagrolaimus sp. PS1159 TaxID=55785 RepID=A0AC35GVN9_9BILA
MLAPNGQKFTIAYNFIFLKATLKAVGKSMKELVIVECPCACCLDSVLFHIIRGEKELRKIIILDNIPEKHESWIRRHTDAKICFPTSKLSKLAKSCTNKSLVIDPADFSSILIPFKD